MSQIGLVGGMGVLEETYLQKLKQNYYVIDNEDINNIHDLRTFKVIIFPSRLGYYNRELLKEIIANDDFKFRLEEFLHHGGRILFFPPLMTESDFDNVWLADSVVLNWSPIGNITYHRKKGTKIKFNAEGDHHITKSLNLPNRLSVVGRFEYSGKNRTIPIITTKRDNRHVIFELKVGSGSILFFTLDLSIKNEVDTETNELYKGFFENVLNWGLYPISSSVLFGPLCNQVKEHFGEKIARFLRKADNKLLENNFPEAGRDAYIAFDMALRQKGKKNRLHDNINEVFPESPEKPEYNICHGIRITRNKTFHGGKSSDEITTEEIEYFISAIKYIFKNLIQDEKFSTK
ncbi:MAG: hypothetical protein GXO65_00825 [Euryarchaeota archaeon]|nr:hypothetical protein [Euryarchaeota archaeon]